VDGTNFYWTALSNGGSNGLAQVLANGSVASNQLTIGTAGVYVRLNPALGMAGDIQFGGGGIPSLDLQKVTANGSTGVLAATVNGTTSSPSIYMNQSTVSNAALWTGAPWVSAMTNNGGGYNNVTFTGTVTDAGGGFAGNGGGLTNLNESAYATGAVQIAGSTMLGGLTNTTYVAGNGLGLTNVQGAVETFYDMTLTNAQAIIIVIFPTNYDIISFYGWLSATSSTVGATVRCQINGDTNALYNWRSEQYADSVSYIFAVSQTQGTIGDIPYNGVFGKIDGKIIGPAASGVYKTINSRVDCWSNNSDATGINEDNYVAYRSANIITQLTLYVTGNKFASGSRLVFQGLKKHNSQ
jgi:hypothetical protein